jgi:hypothetical protein
MNEKSDYMSKNPANYDIKLKEGWNLIERLEKSGQELRLQVQDIDLPSSRQSLGFLFRFELGLKSLE